jgi:hypothetical protein
MELRSHSSVSCHLVATHGTPCQTKQTLLKFILDIPQANPCPNQHNLTLKRGHSYLLSFIVHNRPAIHCPTRYVQSRINCKCYKTYIMMARSLWISRNVFERSGHHCFKALCWQSPAGTTETSITEDVKFKLTFQKTCQKITATRANLDKLFKSRWLYTMLNKKKSVFYPQDLFAGFVWFSPQTVFNFF